MVKDLDRTVFGVDPLNDHVDRARRLQDRAAAPGSPVEEQDGVVGLCCFAGYYGEFVAVACWGTVNGLI